MKLKVNTKTAVKLTLSKQEALQLHAMIVASRRVTQNFHISYAELQDSIIDAVKKQLIDKKELEE